MALAGLILAAGRGKRMRSGLAKVLHPVAGKPMVARVRDAVRGAGVDALLAVVGHQAEAVAAALGPEVRCVLQPEPLGTGHAVLAAATELEAFDQVLVVAGDLPLLTADTLRALVEHHRRSAATATILTCVVDDPRGYGRVVRDASGRFRAIVEDADAGEDVRSIREINTSVYCFRTAPLLSALARVRPDNVQGEVYLVDAPTLMAADGLAVEAVALADAEEVIGVSDRRDLARAEAAARRRNVERLLDAGVTVVDPATTFVDDEVEVGQDTVILPFTLLLGRTRVGSRCRIGPGARLLDTVVGDDCVVGESTLEESELGRGVVVGPYNHLRPGTRLADGARVGNFAELKNARVGRGSKVPHHCYVGDADVGDGVNIGAGAVTVNYDGRRKHPTRIEDGAMIGCNVNLVAPVVVGKDAYVAAGSTITGDVPAGALAIARERQEVRPDWVYRRFGLQGTAGAAGEAEDGAKDGAGPSGPGEGTGGAA